VIYRRHVGSHYAIEQVSDSAWAAIAIPDRGAVGNAGFVRGAEGTIVFDTSVTPQGGRELRAAAEEVAPVVRVVDSHWHGDHVRGNVAFRDLPIVATTRTRELIEEAWPQVEALKREDRAEHLAAGGTRAEVATTIDEVELVLPTETFDERVDLGDGVVLETLGGGHTESDAFLTVGDVVFSADLVVVRSHPWMGHGNPERWLEILDALEARAPRVIVPGHGPVGGVDDVGALRRYIETLLADPDRPPEEGWAFADGHGRNADFVRSR
jgi:glyoxylase-like metal-dependent hydrolase (beta-lactamase superfamily II)